MQFPLIKRLASNRVARNAAVVLLASTAAGCSSDVMRFDDGLFTGSTQNQRSIIAPQASQQPYPGDVAGVDNRSTGSIQRTRRSDVLAGPVTYARPNGTVGQGNAQVAAAPVSQPYPAVTRQPAPSISRQPMAAPPVDRTVTGSTQRPVPQMPPAAPAPTVAAAPQQPGDAGWMRAGGTQVTVRSGETVYNLSKRFGVPVNAILTANGMSGANELAAGQQIVIPTYVYARNAPVSMPDNNPDVLAAKSSRGMKTDVDPSRAPTPVQAPADRLAVLPQTPRVGERPQQAAIAPAAPAPASNGNAYAVVSGDTLSAIARKTGTTTTALKQANNLQDGVLRVGQKLVIPAAGQAPRVQPAVAQAPAVDTRTTGTVPAAAAVVKPEAPAASPRQSEAVIQEASLDPSSAPDATGIGRMRWPARGRVVSGFGGSSGGKRNDGIDISLPEGTAVKAAENGVVIYAGDGLKEFGNTVLVRHENGLVTVYGHASELKVKRGDTVRRGQDIALSGLSGNAQQPKLHFEVRKNSTPVDPAKFLE